MEALKTLIKLQKERHIIIKACDKGAGIIIINFTDYVRACYDHLSSEQTPGSPYYTIVNEIAVGNAKRVIRSTIKEGLDKNIISQSEYIAMNADDKDPARLYCNFKVHKEHAHKQPPSPRPIICGSESLTESIGKFLEHHIKDIANKHKSYLQDNPDFLRNINQINKGPRLKENTLLVTIDAIGLFTNIVHEEGLQCLKEALEKRNDPKVPTNLLL